MVINQSRSKQQETGRTYQKSRRKKLHEAGGLPTLTKIGETRRKTNRVSGDNKKQSLLQVDSVNLYDSKAKKNSLVKIKNVVENTANRNYVRRNILTKGTIIDTEKGKAKITSRPGQEGSISATLI
jgi:small subunit ribosomal protein S8e